MGWRARSAACVQRDAEVNELERALRDGPHDGAEQAVRPDTRDSSQPRIGETRGWDAGTR
jgi:hypothetical protein